MQGKKANVKEMKKMEDSGRHDHNQLRILALGGRDFHSPKRRLCVSELMILERFGDEPRNSDFWFGIYTVSNCSSVSVHRKADGETDQSPFSKSLKRGGELLRD